MESLPRKVILSSFNRSDLKSLQLTTSTPSDDNELQTIVDNEMREQALQINVEGQHRDTDEMPVLEQLLVDFGLSNDDSDSEPDIDFENDFENLLLQ